MGAHWTDGFFDSNFAQVMAKRDSEPTHQQVDLIVEKTGVTQGSRVLDACCGFGRHSLELARQGFDVVGVDRFESYLQEGRRRASEERLSVEFIPMDVRNLQFQGEFDLVINMWTSFGFFDEETNASILRSFKACLEPGGALFMQLINRDWVVKNFQPRGWWEVDDELIVIERRELDLATSVIKGEWRFLRGGKIEDKQMILRIYSCHEFFSLLRSCGFAGMEAYGDSEGNPLTPDSRMMSIKAISSKQG